MSNRHPNGAGTIYPRKDGRYEGAAWVKPSAAGAPRIRVYGRTWEETNQALIKAIAEHQNGPGAATDKRTLAAYLEHWITHVAPHHVRANTLANYRQSIDMRIIPALGGKELDKLSAKDIRSWLDRIASQCRCCTQHIDAKRTPEKQRCCALGQCCRLVPAPRRLQYYHGVLASAVAHAVREDLLPRNVAKQVQVPPGHPTATNRSPSPRPTPSWPRRADSSTARSTNSRCAWVCAAANCSDCAGATSISPPTSSPSAAPSNASRALAWSRCPPRRRARTGASPSPRPASRF
jgi:hypothetical protein